MTLPSTAVETAIAQCTSRWAMARGHSLNTSIVLAAVLGLSGLFRAVAAVEPSLSRPLPLFPLSPSLISHLASEDVKQYGLSCISMQTKQTIIFFINTHNICRFGRRLNIPSALILLIWFVPSFLKIQRKQNLH